MKGNDDDLPVESEEETRVSPGVMGSRTSHLDDQLLEALEEAFFKSNPQNILHDLAKLAQEHSPVDLGFAVTRMPGDVQLIVYQNLSNIRDQVEFLVNTDTNTRRCIFRGMEDVDLQELLENTPSDEAVEFVEILPERRVRSVLALLDKDTCARLRELLRHGHDTAGRLMTNEIFSFGKERSIGEVATAIRENPEIDLTRRIFVVNEEGELQGFVPSRNLIISHSATLLRQVMQPILHQIGPDATREEIVDVVERYKIPALPVVTEKGVLLGVITYEDVVEVMEDIADETIAKMAGTSEDVSEHEPFYKRFFLRAPWLIVTLFSGLWIATTLEHFDDRPWYIFVSIFIPLVTGLSGTVGIQCSTVLLRSMATGELSPGTRMDAMVREFSLGTAIGIVFGLFAGVFVFFLNYFEIHEVGPNPFLAGGIVSLGVFGACLMSTTLGVFSPFIFSRIGIDPALSSGPIVTAFNDALSTGIYCFIAYLAMNMFV